MKFQFMTDQQDFAKKIKEAGFKEQNPSKIYKN